MGDGDPFSPAAVRGAYDATVEEEHHRQPLDHEHPSERIYLLLRPVT